MAFGFGSKSNSDNAKLSPEHQLTKLREQARSGGGGGGGHAPPRLPVDAPITPKAVAPSGQDDKEERGITLELTPDANDQDMEELLSILRRKGFKAVLKELDRIDNPHLEDDFHRLLVQYKHEGHHIPGLEHGHGHGMEAQFAEVLDFVLLEVAVYEATQGKPGSSLKEICSQMEQLYLAMLPYIAIPDNFTYKDWRRRQIIYPEHFAMELAVSHGSEDAIFYLAVPRHKKDMVEKQIFSVFPRARIAEKKDDYNPFNQFGATEIAHGAYKRAAVVPIKLHDDFSYDPLNVTLSSLSKITREGEGVAIQFTVAPAGEYHTKRMWAVLDEINEGKKSVAQIFFHFKYLEKYPLWRRFVKAAPKAVSEALSTSEKKKDDHKHVDAIAAEMVGKKIKSVIAGVNLRVVASARTRERAQHLLNDVQATFGQFDDPKGNRFTFYKPKNAQAKRNLIRKFIFRTFDDGGAKNHFRHEFFERLFENVTGPLYEYSPLMPMNLAELSTVYHVAISGGTASREAKTSQAKRLPAPPGMSERGITVGKNTYSNIETLIRFQPEDRLRHMYTIGQTGTGKTNFLKNMIIQDIENGEGVCFIDPHGVDVVEILSRIPKERYDDLIYFDPAYMDRPLGLNMLEYDPRDPEQKTFVVDEMFKIFQKLYGQVPEAFGPIFEQYFRNATLLVLEDPETGSTLMDISRVLADEDFRHLKLSRCRNAVVRHFWEDIAENVRGEGDLRNVVPYITSKFDIFIANEIMRPIVGQQRSAFNFKDIMDNKKILLVNLSKGRLGDLNANLLGLVIVGKIMMTALARTEYLHTNPPPFYLYIDEFQNVTTNTIAIILAEARKFRLSMTMAHQYIQQLIPEIKNAVFGNVGTQVIFRIGPDDADYMAKQFDPYLGASDFLKVDNYHAYIRLLASGKPMPPFSLETIPFIAGDFANTEALKHMSYQRFGRAREAVEEEIRQKYDAMRESQ